MVLSVAMTEAYAVADVRGDLLHTLELDHPTFPQPLRFVCGDRVPGVFETMTLPVAGNPAAVFTVVAFNWTGPGQGDGGTTKAKIRVDNVSRQLQEPLRAAIVSGAKLTVTYRCYSTNDPNNPEVYDGLKMSDVNLNAVSANGDLYYEDIELQAFPRQTYSLPLYPALYGQ